MRLLFIFVKGDILANALIFVLAFLHMSETLQSNVSSLSILTSNNFSQSLFSLGNSLIFIFAFSSVLTIKCHLSGLPLNKLSLNHFSKLLDAFSRESIKSSILFADVNGALSSAKLAISTSFKTKNKSARNILNKRGPNIDPQV